MDLDAVSAVEGWVNYIRVEIVEREGAVYVLGVNVGDPIVTNVYRTLCTHILCPEGCDAAYPRLL